MDMFLFYSNNSESLDKVLSTQATVTRFESLTMPSLWLQELRQVPWEFAKLWDCLGPLSLHETVIHNNYQRPSENILARLRNALAYQQQQAGGRYNLQLNLLRFEMIWDLFVSWFQKEQRGCGAVASAICGMVILISHPMQLGCWWCWWLWMHWTF